MIRRYLRIIGHTPNNDRPAVKVFWKFIYFRLAMLHAS